jgi:hypothetical protein
MQGERNNGLGLGGLESGRHPSSFDNFSSLDSFVTSYCLDPTVALACD